MKLEVVDWQGNVEDDKTVYPESYPESYTCFHTNDKIRATAIPEPGYVFSHWSIVPYPDGFVSTANPTEFVHDPSELQGSGFDLVAYFTGGLPAPMPPANVSATDGSYNDRIEVTWSASQDAESYTLYRSTGSAGSTRSYLATVSGTTYTDMNISCGENYYYWLRARNTTGPSPYSDYDSGYCSESGGGGNPPNPPPQTGVNSVTAKEAKALLDKGKDIFVFDVSGKEDFEAGHIFCAMYAPWTGMSFNYNAINFPQYKNTEVLIYDQEGTNAQTAANHLAGQGFTSIYYMPGGLEEWAAKGYEVIPSDCNCEKYSIPPMAYAGADQEVNEGVSVTLDASGSAAPGGGSLTYSWRLASDGTKVSLSDRSSKTPKFTAPAVQEGGEDLIFHLTVSDAGGTKDMDSVTVTVAWSNSPPVADAGQDQVVKEGDSVTLNGMKSSDAEGRIRSYLWEQTGGGPEVELIGPGTINPDFIAPSVTNPPVVLTFRLTVTDGDQKTDSDEVRITVQEGNDQPVARARVAGAATVKETQTIELDGSESTDNDGEIIAWRWTQVSGPYIGMSDTEGMRVSCPAPSLEDGSDDVELAFQLVVTDNEGLESQPDEVVITVEEGGHPPTAHAGHNHTAHGGGSITLDASFSKDFDGSVAAYEWKVVEGPEGMNPGDIVLVDADKANPTVTLPEMEEGVVILSVTITDNDGLQDTDLVKVRVTNSQPPVADAGEDQRVNEGKTIMLDGSGSTDPDGDIAQYEWKQIEGPPGELTGETSATAEFKAPPVEKDRTCTFELSVTDGSGNTRSDQVKVTVNNGSSGGGGGGGCFIKTFK
jgi:rhodanese-related sulfurtransferase